MYIHIYIYICIVVRETTARFPRVSRNQDLRVDRGARKRSRRYYAQSAY